MVDPTHQALVRAAFDRAAPTYDAAAAVQQEICDDLLALAKQHPPANTHCLLDAGCGTGRGALRIAELINPQHHVSLDFAPGMLNAITPRQRSARLCADMQALPLRDASVDVIWSSLAIQWCEPSLALKEFERVLVPGGCAWVATLGPRTLYELKAAFGQVDTARHVIEFHAMEHWLATARHAGLIVDEARQIDRAATAPTLSALLKDIKAIGAHAVGGGRRTKPLGKRGWHQLESAYETHRRADGLLPATYDVLLISLRKVP